MIVIDVETGSSGIPRSSVCISSMESMATPTLPTSPRAAGASESYPIWVGRSNATDSPVLPASISWWYRRFDSSAVEKPEYCRIVHGLAVYMAG